MQPVIPGYVAPIILAISITLAFWLYRLVSRGAESAGLALPDRTRVRGATALFLGVWLALAFLRAPSTPVVDAAGRGLIPTNFLLFGGIPLAIALGLLAFSSTWRRVVDAIPAGSLVSVQVYRLIGAMIFLPVYAVGSLPAYFALPAGWGDAAVGFLAPFVALALNRQTRGARWLGLSWNLFGLIDLVVAVGLGTGLLLSLLHPGVGQVPPAAAMTFFPLALIPTFAVPLGFILHIYSIQRTLRGGHRTKSGDSVRLGTRGAATVSS
jgi:hypothetical protein